MEAPDPTFLLVPDDDGRALARLQRKLLLKVAGFLLGGKVPGLPAHSARTLEHVRSVLVPSLEAHPDALLRALGSPDVLAPLMMTMARRLSPEDGLRRALPTLLLGAVSHGALVGSLEYDFPFGTLVHHAGLRVLRFDEPVLSLDVTPSEAHVVLTNGQRVTLERMAEGRATAPTEPTLDGVRAEHPFHLIDPRLPGLHLSEYDSNPLFHVQDHPDARANAMTLGGAPVSAWQERLRDALEFIRVALPGWAREQPVTLQRLVPVGVEPERHLSASFREAPGLVYMTLHPDALVMAEALIHETQHGKLHTLMRLDPVLVNGDTHWTSSPVRPDLRPLSGILLAAHAFLPVALMYQRIHQQGLAVPERTRFELRYARVLAGNRNAMAILARDGIFSQAGARMWEGMKSLQAYTERHAPPIPRHPDLADLLPPG